MNKNTIITGDQSLARHSYEALLFNSLGSSNVSLIVFEDRGIGLTEDLIKKLEDISDKEVSYLDDSEILKAPEALEFLTTTKDIIFFRTNKTTRSANLISKLDFEILSRPVNIFLNRFNTEALPAVKSCLKKSRSGKVSFTIFLKGVSAKDYRFFAGESRSIIHNSARRGVDASK